MLMLANGQDLINDTTVQATLSCHHVNILAN